MPSKLPRATFVISEEEYQMVKDYQKKHNIKSISKAIIALVEDGLIIEQRRIAEQEAVQNEQQPAPCDGDELSKLEVEVVKEFRALPASQRGLAASLCLAVIQTLLKHQTIGTETQSYVQSNPVH